MKSSRPTPSQTRLAPPTSTDALELRTKLAKLRPDKSAKGATCAADSFWVLYAASAHEPPRVAYRTSSWTAALQHGSDLLQRGKLPSLQVVDSPGSFFVRSEDGSESATVLLRSQGVELSRPLGGLKTISRWDFSAPSMAVTPEVAVAATDMARRWKLLEAYQTASARGHDANTYDECQAHLADKPTCPTCESFGDGYPQLSHRCSVQHVAGEYGVDQQQLVAAAAQLRSGRSLTTLTDSLSPAENDVIELELLYSQRPADCSTQHLQYLLERVRGLTATFELLDMEGPLPARLAALHDRLAEEGLKRMGGAL